MERNVGLGTIKESKYSLRLTLGVSKVNVNNLKKAQNSL